jgi:hypothetical protein
MTGRSFQIIPIAKQGDNEKALIVGEYGVEVRHAGAMGRLRV